MGIIRKFLLVIQQPLQLLCEMTHLAFVVLRQGLKDSSWSFWMCSSIVFMTETVIWLTFGC